MPASNRKIREMRELIDLWNSSKTVEEANDKIMRAKLCDTPRRIQLRVSYLRSHWCDVETLKYLPSRHRKAQHRGADPDIRKPVKFNYDKTDPYGN